VTSINTANTAYWNDLCGSHLARVLGLTNSDAKSLSRFDAWYFDYYPYLIEWVMREKPAGKYVLEVGLGYGSLGQWLASNQARYLGLDIAAEPVAMMRHRLDQTGLPGHARQCSFLDNGLPSATVDILIAVGSFHHTGDLEGCIAETLRLLRHGGVALIMVYNRHSYRHFRQHLLATALSALRDRWGKNPFPAETKASFLGRYDADQGGNPAPFTEFVGVGQARRMLRQFQSVRIRKENCADEFILRCCIERKRLRPIIGPLAGTDLYIRAVK
jgi:SAM-dependent methyltransferase